MLRAVACNQMVEKCRQTEGPHHMCTSPERAVRLSTSWWRMQPPRIYSDITRTPRLYEFSSLVCVKFNLQIGEDSINHVPLPYIQWNFTLTAWILRQTPVSFSGAFFRFSNQCLHNYWLKIWKVLEYLTVQSLPGFTHTRTLTWIYTPVNGTFKWRIFACNHSKFYFKWLLFQRFNVIVTSCRIKTVVFHLYQRISSINKLFDFLLVKSHHPYNIIQ